MFLVPEHVAYSYFVRRFSCIHLFGVLCAFFSPLNCFFDLLPSSFGHASVVVDVATSHHHRYQQIQVRLVVPSPLPPVGVQARIPMPDGRVARVLIPPGKRPGDAISVKVPKLMAQDARTGPQHMYRFCGMICYYGNACDHKPDVISKHR